MRSFLKHHPFGVQAFFKSSLVLAFAFPKDLLQALIPPRLELDTYQNTHAFLAVAMVQTVDLRPQGFPKFLGQDFFLIGYRIFVRYTDRSGRRLRGLFILKSQTDKARMAFFGNIFTQYNYSVIAVTRHSTKDQRHIESAPSGFSVTVASVLGDVPLPQHSPFSDWKIARRFAGPLPFTFTVDSKTQEVVIIEGVREHWLPEPVAVTCYHIPYFESLKLANPLLANAFEVRDVPYFWKKGRVDS